MPSLFLSGPHPLPGPCGEAQSVQHNPCYRPAPAPSHQSWCLPASLLCKMRRTEPGEERTSPEALDGYQTQNRGAVRLLPASFRRKSACPGDKARGGVLRRGCGTAGSACWSLCPLCCTPQTLLLDGEEADSASFGGGGAVPLGGSSTGRACSLVLWQLRWGPRAGLGQSGVPPRTLGLEPRMPVVRWSDGRQGGGSRQEFSDAPPGRCTRHHYRRDFSLCWGGHRVVLT